MSLLRSFAEEFFHGLRALARREKLQLLLLQETALAVSRREYKEGYLVLIVGRMDHSFLMRVVLFCSFLSPIFPIGQIGDSCQVFTKPVRQLRIS